MSKKKANTLFPLNNLEDLTDDGLKELTQQITQEHNRRVRESVLRLAGGELIELSYRCRVNQPGDDPEEGIVEGFFTGEVDVWGKHTFRTSNGETLYLFKDEILDTDVG